MNSGLLSHCGTSYQNYELTYSASCRIWVHLSLVDRVQTIIVQRTQSNKVQLDIIAAARIPCLAFKNTFSITLISEVRRVEHTLYNVNAFPYSFFSSNITACFAILKIIIVSSDYVKICLIRWKTKYRYELSDMDIITMEKRCVYKYHTIVREIWELSINSLIILILCPNRTYRLYLDRNCLKYA